MEAELPEDGVELLEPEDLEPLELREVDLDLLPDELLRLLEAVFERVAEPELRALPPELGRVRVRDLEPELELEPERRLLDFLRPFLEGEGREAGRAGGEGALGCEGREGSEVLLSAALRSREVATPARPPAAVPSPGLAPSARAARSADVPTPARPPAAIPCSAAPRLPETAVAACSALSAELATPANPPAATPRLAALSPPRRESLAETPFSSPPRAESQARPTAAAGPTRPAAPAQPSSSRRLIS